MDRKQMFAKLRDTFLETIKERKDSDNFYHAIGAEIDSRKELEIKEVMIEQLKGGGVKSELVATALCLSETIEEFAAYLWFIAQMQAGYLEMLKSHMKK